MLRFSFGNTPNHTLVFLYQINSTALHVTLCTQTHPQLTTLSGCPTDRQTDRERKHCSNKQQFPWQLWGKTGEAAIGWQAGSGRTMSEGLKGFPWPLMPPEILKPRPGFFSILTHSYRERRERYRKKRKEKKRQDNNWKWNTKLWKITAQTDSDQTTCGSALMCDGQYVLAPMLYWRSFMEQQLRHWDLCFLFRSSGSHLNWHSNLMLWNV